MWDEGTTCTWENKHEFEEFWTPSFLIKKKKKEKCNFTLVSVGDAACIFDVNDEWEIRGLANDNCLLIKYKIVSQLLVLKAYLIVRNDIQC